MRSIIALSTLPLLLLLGLAACGDSTIPSPPEADEALFDGEIDPGGGSFVLARIDQPGLVPLRIELVGSNLQINEDRDQVSIDVSLVNRGERALYPDALIWISNIQPPRVSVANPDIVPPTLEVTSPIPFLWGFDYSEFLGEDGALEPGDISEPKTWEFWNPEMVSFSFTARAEFGFEPEKAEIGGTLWEDLNRNGIIDPDERPFRWGVVVLEGPDGKVERGETDEFGRYRFGIEHSGLYTVGVEPTIRCVLCYTTPNPREVLIVPGPDGSPQSALGIDFGALCGPCDPNQPVPVILTEDPPDSLMPQDSFMLIEGRVEGELLHLRVGFSGCGPEHPFQLMAGAGFMESNPVATWLRLLHDDRGELCDAWFERDLVFDLGPIQEAHIEAYGGPGPVRLLFHNPQGIPTEWLLEP